jgi:aconitate hydratase
MADSFGARGELEIDGSKYSIFRLDALAAEHEVQTLPYCLRVLLENVLRHEGTAASAAQIEAVAGWKEGSKPGSEISFTPARVLLQDFTGVPAIVDLE